MKQFSYIIAITCLVFSACTNRSIFEDNVSIPDNVWDRNQKVVFDVDVKDTISSYNFYINIRNAGNYPFSNLQMFINTTFPDGHSMRDTVECILADESGKWLGDGLGDIWDNRVLFKKGVVFPSSGVFKFEFEQAMRVEKLPMIMDVGLKVEKN